MAGTTPPRRQAPFFIGLILILAVLPLGYFLFLQPPPPPPLPPAPPPAPVEEKVPDKPVQMEFGEVKGTVEVRHGDGEWVPAKRGMPLRPSDSVRTKGDSSAELVGDAATVSMDPGTEVSVKDLTSSLSQLLLDSGMATAVVRPGKKQTFELKAAGADAVARTSEGTFTMSNDGKGTVAVGTRQGEVQFLGGGKVVIVRAGMQSVIRPGDTAPSEPTEIPSSLLRKVQWPTGRQNRREVIVQGEAVPGSRLEINGEAFSPTQDGSFVRKVSLKEGENDVKIKASSVGGGKEEASQNILVDTRPPKLKIKTPWQNSEGQPPPAQGQQ